MIILWVLYWQLINPKGSLDKMEQSAVSKKIDCMNCQANYVSEAGKKLWTRFHEHRCAINRHDVKSQIWTHMVENDHWFARVISHGNSKDARLMMEAWPAFETTLKSAYRFASSPSSSEDWHGQMRKAATGDLKQTKNRRDLLTPWFRTDSPVEYQWRTHRWQINGSFGPTPGDDKLRINALQGDDVGCRSVTLCEWEK